VINRLRRTRVGVPIGNSDSIGLAVTTSNTIVANYGKTAAGVVTEKVIPQAPVDSPVKVLTASGALDVADAGKVIVFDSTTSIVATLPSAASCKGCRYRFHWKQLTSASTGHSVSPAATDGVGGGVTALTTVINKDVHSPNASDAVTDRLEIQSTGVAGTGAWVIVEAVGTFTKEA
jgi:hypothetical protein